MFDHCQETKLKVLLLRFLASALALWPIASRADDDVAVFYKGRTVAIQVGSEVGGNYDIIARTIARHMGKYIRGQPTMVVQDVPGGGGLKLLNQLYALGPRDGLVIGAAISGATSGALLTPNAAKFDPRKFAWVGSAGTETFIVVVSDKSPVQTLDDLFRRELIVGASAAGGASVDFPLVANAILGTRFKVVSGYPAAGTVVKLAMPSGEVDGCSVFTLSALKSQYARELAEGKIRILAQWGTRKDPEIEHVPLLPLGKTDADRQLFEALYSRQNYGRPYMLPPGVPPDRTAAIRSAFAAVFRDPAFQSEAERQKLDVSYVSGDEIAALTERMMATPPAVVSRIHALIPGG
jgi:tripartite-type tricarboxylate transporter receptor subunit TctC